MDKKPIGYIARLDGYNRDNVQIEPTYIMLPNNLELETTIYDLFHHLFNNNYGLSIPLSHFNKIFPPDEVRPIILSFLNERPAHKKTTPITPKQIMKGLGLNRTEIENLIFVLSGGLDTTDILLCMLLETHYRELIYLNEKSIIIKHPGETFNYATSIEAINLMLHSLKLPQIVYESHLSKSVLDRRIKSAFKTMRKNGDFIKQPEIHTTNLDKIEHFINVIKEEMGINLTLINTQLDVLCAGVRFKNCLRNRWKSEDINTLLFEDTTNKVLLEINTSLKELGHVYKKSNEHVDKAKYHEILDYFLSETKINSLPDYNKNEFYLTNGLLATNIITNVNGIDFEIHNHIRGVNWSQTKNENALNKYPDAINVLNTKDLMVSLDIRPLFI